MRVCVIVRCVWVVWCIVSVRGLRVVFVGCMCVWVRFVCVCVCACVCGVWCVVGCLCACVWWVVWCGVCVWCVVLFGVCVRVCVCGVWCGLVWCVFCEMGSVCVDLGSYGRRAPGGERYARQNIVTREIQQDCHSGNLTL